MSFETIQGQETAIRVLRSALRRGRVASAYLFFGPDGVGKRMTANAFAAALLCPEGRERGAACGACPSCVRREAGGHPGLLEVAVPPGRTSIRLEQIQELSERLSLRPIEGERTVAVLDEVERAGIEALNALLKTLEEPAFGVTMLLVTSVREALPETIRSRCQGVRFRPLPEETVWEILRVGEGLEAGEAKLLARVSEGSPGRARRLLELGIADLLAEALRRGGRLPEPGGRTRTSRETATAILRAALEGRREALCRDPSVLPEVEPEMRGIAEALVRLGRNVNPELLLRALAERRDRG